MYAFHDSHSAAYRRPFGAAACGAEVFLALDADDCAVSCSLRLTPDDAGDMTVPMRKETRDGGVKFIASVRMPDTGTLVWYHFVLTDTNGNISYYGNNTSMLGGAGENWDEHPASYQITVYKPSKTPDWYKSAIVYQIFPDRFMRGSDWEDRRKNAALAYGKNGPRRVFQEDWDDTPFYTKAPDGQITRWPFFGGTLEGIREKLGYLKNLGVSAVYLNPIFKAASSHRYDTGDYTQIDPGLGDEAGFRALCAEAGKLGIRIILDGVFNHTGADSIYFNRYGNYGTGGAYQDKDSPYASWYRFEEFPDKYDSWWGVKDLPSVCEDAPSYHDFICGGEGSVIRRWLRAGASGWRLDVADELPDSFIRDIRRAMDAEKPGSVLLGEVWEDASNKISYGEKRRYFMGEELHSTMNYPFRDLALDFMLGRIPAGKLAARLINLMENYPPENFYGALNLIGSHDRRRVMTVLGDAPDSLTDAEREGYRLPAEKEDLARRRLKILSLLQFSIPGVPCIYYGDEAGMQGYEDPYNRGPYPWGGEDGGLLWHYRMIGALRRDYPCLTDGSFEPLFFGEHVFGCRREKDGEEIVVLINRGIFEHVDISIPTDKAYILELLQSREYKPENGAVSLSMLPVSAVMFLFRKAPPAKAELPRASGVLCHVTSIPSKDGPGKLGENIPNFLRFLKNSGQKLWQVLPLCPVGMGDSPYMSPSVFAGNERLIDPKTEVDMSGFDDFCSKNTFWLDDHALYTALRAKYGVPWQRWPVSERDRTDLSSARSELSDEMLRIKKTQYIFAKQWARVRGTAKELGISIIGDIPVFASVDSADVWANRDLFMLDENGDIALSGGAPPDGFTPDGQNWNCPLYNWDKMRENGFLWWKRRVETALQKFDYIRLDHFRGFSAYYAIPAGKSAKDGFWMKSPGMALFRALSDNPLPMIAEDLGMLDTGVYNLLKLTGYPGMNVWQFSAGEMAAMPPEEASNRVFYSGTHDNDTIAGWCASEYPGSDAKEKAIEIITGLYSSPAPWVILPLQDILLLGSEARMNTPGTCTGNWGWQADYSQLTDDTADYYRVLADKYDR